MTITEPGGAPLAGTDVLILAGGRGSRLGQLGESLPKPLVEVGGRPFIDILLDDLVAAGARRFILCTGYLGEQIEAHLRLRQDAVFAFSREQTPLGTGGAVQRALAEVRSARFLVLNGDSYCKVAYGELLRYHVRQGSRATLVLSTGGVRADAGAVLMETGGCITGFQEKAGAAKVGSFLNAGIYLFEGKPLELTEPAVPFSLEYAALPALAATGRCFGFAVDSEVVDIGTPERLTAAGQKLPARRN